MTIRAVFTQEANLECEKLINSPKNILNIVGESVRSTTIEAIQTLYNLTK